MSLIIYIPLLVVVAIVAVIFFRRRPFNHIKMTVVIGILIGLAAILALIIAEPGPNWAMVLVSIFIVLIGVGVTYVVLRALATTFAQRHD